jgi:hypothetical protein
MEKFNKLSMCKYIIPFILFFSVACIQSIEPGEPDVDFNVQLNYADLMIVVSQVIDGSIAADLVEVRAAFQEGEMGCAYEQSFAVLICANLNLQMEYIVTVTPLNDDFKFYESDPILMDQSKALNISLTAL